jgi:2-isopropylmalate synthase
MRPQDVGVPDSTLVLGKHSGRHAVQKACERLGLSLSRRELDDVYKRMTALADRTKQITDADLLGIAEAICGVAAVPVTKSASH